MGRGKGKGGGFERDCCRAFSSWWTGGRSDDIYWRSASSGGRATQRAAKGKRTSGSYGDMTSLHHSGAPLLDVFTIELKRGYTKSTYADVIDRPNQKGVQQIWDQWHQQAVTSAAGAGSASWMIVQQRDKRPAMVFYPWHIHKHLMDAGCFPKVLTPFIKFKADFRHKLEPKGWSDNNREVVVGMTLSDWFACVSPEVIVDVSRWI